MRAYVQKGAHPEAIALAKKAHELSGGIPAMTMLTGYAYGAAGRKADAHKMIGALKQRSRRVYVPAFLTAAIHTALRNTEPAIAWLRRAREERCDYLVYLDREPAADALRSDPRFDEIVPRPPSRD